MAATSQFLPLPPSSAVVVGRSRRSALGILGDDTDVPSSRGDADVGAGLALASAVLTEKKNLGRARRVRVDLSFDAVKAVVLDYVADAPSPLHQDALFAIALASVVDASLLAAMLDCEPAVGDELFRWLEALRFAERSRDGVSLHPLAREAIHGHLVSEDSARLQRLVERATAVLLDRMSGALVPHGYRHLQHALHVHRDSTPGAMPFRELPATHLRQCEPHTLDALAAIVETWEGAESAARFRIAFELQPRMFFGLYDAEEQPVGVLAFVGMRDLPASVREGDRLLESAWSVWQAQGAEGQAELAFARWWMTRKSYQKLCKSAEPLVCATSFVAALRAPDVRWVAHAVSDGEGWAPIAKALGMATLDTVPVGSRTHLLTVIDVHASVGVGLPADTAAQVGRRHFDDLLAVRQRASAERPRDPAWFADALRSTLPDLRRPHRLGTSALLASRVVGNGGVRAAIEAACDKLAAEPAYAESARVLRATYFGPEQKQQAVAADLRLPFGTYRHHLRRAVEDLAMQLYVDESSA